MIQKTIKTLYKLKNVTFDTEGRLIDEDGEIYDLKEDLQEIFGTESFYFNGEFSRLRIVL